MINLKKELLIFTGLFIVSSLIIHWSAWISNPIIQFQTLFSHAMPYHPLLYVFLIYIVVVIFRVVITLFKKLFSRK